MTPTMDEGRTYTGAVRALERQGAAGTATLSFWIDNVGQVEAAEALCQGLREGDSVVVRGRLNREAILIADAVTRAAPPAPRRSWWRIVRIVAAIVLPLPLLLLLLWVVAAVAGPEAALSAVVLVMLAAGALGIGMLIFRVMRRR